MGTRAPAMDEDEDMLTCMMSAHEDFQQQLGAILLAKDLRGLAKRVVMDGQAEILADRARTVRAALNAWTAVETPSDELRAALGDACTAPFGLASGGWVPLALQPYVAACTTLGQEVACLATLLSCSLDLAELASGLPSVYFQDNEDALVFRVPDSRLVEMGPETLFWVVVDGCGEARPGGWMRVSVPVALTLSPLRVTVWFNGVQVVAGVVRPAAFIGSRVSFDVTKIGKTAGLSWYQWPVRFECGGALYVADPVARVVRVGADKPAVQEYTDALVLPVRQEGVGCWNTMVCQVAGSPRLLVRWGVSCKDGGHPELPSITVFEDGKPLGVRHSSVFGF